MGGPSGSVWEECCGHVKTNNQTQLLKSSNCFLHSYRLHARPQAAALQTGVPFFCLCPPPSHDCPRTSAAVASSKPSPTSTSALLFSPCPPPLILHHIGQPKPCLSGKEALLSRRKELGKLGYSLQGSLWKARRETAENTSVLIF